jgi:hypothetical protein
MMMSWRLLGTIFLCFGLGLAPVTRGDAGSFKDLVTDPKDGKFDISDWLVNHKEFLLIAEIITDPAIGFGLGLGLTFFNLN